VTPKEIAEEIQRVNGSWIISELGRAGLDDLIWDAHEPYQGMSIKERAALLLAVGEELFG
jgi:hypothetical protein